MARTIVVSLPADKTEGLVHDLDAESSVVGLSLQRGASLKPRGDVLTIQATNEGLERAFRLLQTHGVGENSSVLTSEPNSLVSGTQQGQVDEETNEATWPEMAALLRRETNITSNYLLAMACAGLIAAVGLWTDTLHLVIGAMVIAPGFEPIIRVPFGVLARGDRAWKTGLKSTAAGYAAMIAAAAATLLVMTILQGGRDFGSQHWVQYWSSVKPSGIVVSLAAGAAGAAIIAAQRSVLTAGVMIALALIPSASILGMGLAAGDIPLAGKGLLRWLTDAGCVVIAGGAVFWIKRALLRKRGGTGTATEPLKMRDGTAGA